MHPSESGTFSGFGADDEASGEEAEGDTESWRSPAPRRPRVMSAVGEGEGREGLEADDDEDSEGEGARPIRHRFGSGDKIRHGEDFCNIGEGDAEALGIESDGFDTDSHGGPSGSYFYESDHGELDMGPWGHRHAHARKLKQSVTGLVSEWRRRQEAFKQTQQDLAKSVNKRWSQENQKLRGKLMTQQQRLVRRSQQMAAKLKSGQATAWRHKWVFALAQTELIGSAYWFGASPETFYRYYTAHFLVAMSYKIFDYGTSAQHYFLIDFCYFANVVVLTWMWLFPTHGVFFNAAEGVCGLLAISVVLFRNSCVPHDFVRMTHAYVHYPALVVMLSVKLRCEGQLCQGMEDGQSQRWFMRFAQAWGMYLCWAFAYSSVIFGLARDRIERKKRDTLYHYMAISLGYRNKIPGRLKAYSGIVFMCGHMSLFLIGLVWIFLPRLLQGLSVILSMLAFFHNGGRFYVDHFWKAYEKNTVLYVDAAIAVMSKGGGAGTVAEPPGEALDCKADESIPGHLRGNARAEASHATETE